MKANYLTIGIKTIELLKLLVRNKISLYPKYILRLFFLYQGSIWASLFSIVESVRYKTRIKSTPVPEDPIIIIGHWRTGSTFLHQLMNLDPNLVAPSLFQVSVPDSFLISRRYYEPIMKGFMGKNRPMDMVKIGLDEPQEEESAIFRMCGISPMKEIIFPNNSKYFLSDYKTFVPESNEYQKWENALIKFCKKLSLESGSRIILKNPFHSMRINTLVNIFPKARFIHIYRNPHIVVPSTIRMWDIVGSQNCLNNLWSCPNINEVVDLLDKMLSSIRQNLNKLPKENYCEIKFEDFEKTPLQSLKKMYKELDLEFKLQFEDKVRGFLLEVSDYKKNDYKLSNEDRNLVDSKLKEHMEYYNY